MIEDLIKYFKETPREQILKDWEESKELGNYEKLIEEYYEAKEKVLFEGFENSTIDELKIMFKICKLNIIENLLNYKEEIQLTENAIKQIGL